MPAPILATKLHIPSPRPALVLRARLLDRLHAGRQCRSAVTLISAPAGFGKTTLVSEWLSTFTAASPAGTKAAWLSLDEADSDPARFLTYLIAALQTVAADVGTGALAALQSSQPPPVEALVTSLLNDLAALSDNFILVLDDYHVIESPALDEALTFFVDHLPPQLRLVIASREDPPLPLARLRARGQLTELRAADLRFTPAETAEFLNRVMGLNLSADDIAALEQRTEGWIAGLQLAAISMQGRSDAARFIASFTGSHRFVLDYLIEEVLRRQPGPVRDFLLQTSILERLTSALCKAVTEQADGQALLETLERANLFVIPLDDQREWYRYHHLFAEVLQVHLKEAQPDRVAELHRRASGWFEQHDLPPDAIRHALLAQDFERAARLIERVWLAMDLTYQSSTWLAWARALPADLIRRHPVLCLGYAWALLNSGELETSEVWLREAERWLQPRENSAAQTSPAQSQEMVVVDEAEFRALPASIAGARAYRALAVGNIAATKLFARQTLELVGAEDRVRRTQATALLGMAEYASGDLAAAEHYFLDFQAMMWQANDLANAIGITFVLANIQLAQGRLDEVVRAYQQSLALAQTHGTPFFIGVSDLYRGLGEVLCEQGQIEAAAQHLQTARQLGERGALTGWPHRLSVAQARLKDAQGDLAGALVLLDEAERQYVRNPLPDRPVAALKARAWIRLGQLTAARSWVRDQRLSPDDDVTYLREFEHLTLARVLIADRVDDALQAALRLLQRLLQAAEAGGRNGSVIEVLILQALAHHAQDDLPGALAALDRALALAEPAGYVRLFVDEGQPMRSLLEKRPRDQARKLIGYADKLLAAFAPTPQPPSTVGNQQADMLEPLSEREREVLKLLGTELSGPDIARRLNVSLNTLRTHTKNIYSKLGANNRRAAIKRADELDLLS